MKQLKILSIMMLALMMTLLVASCGQNSKAQNMSQAEMNAIDFAKNHVSQLALNKEISIEGVDTLLYDDSPFLNDERWDSIQTSYSKGKTKDREIEEYISKLTTHLAAVYSSWCRTSYDNERLKVEKEFEPYWHEVYRISFGGNVIRIIMDKDGVKPIETESDFKERMNKKKVNNTSGDRSYSF